MSVVQTMYRDLSAKLYSFSDRDHSRKDSIFHKGYLRHSLGIKAPVFRKLMKKWKNVFKSIHRDKIFDFTLKFAEQEIEEFVLTGNEILKLNYASFKKTDIDRLNEYANHFVSWSTVDDFCCGFLTKFIMSADQKVIKIISKLLRHWNQSDDMWRQRASVVAFTRKVGECGEFTDIALKLCERLIDSDRDLVRKGVGWCLKDIMRGDKKKVLNYVIGLRKRKVSSTITLYALRDVKGDERKRIL
jgi:3-methyladenine DNA glycosylase AlkD